MTIRALAGQRKNHPLTMGKASGYAIARPGRKRQIYGKPRAAYLRLLDLHAHDTEHARTLARTHDGLNSDENTRGFAGILP